MTRRMFLLTLPASTSRLRRYVASDTLVEEDVVNDNDAILSDSLDERGINTQLAIFVPDYIDFKEQREYLGWLENVKGFVSA